MPRQLFSIIPVLIIAVVFCCYSCHQPVSNATSQAKDSIPSTDSLPRTNNYEKLLSSYQDVSFDTLHIFPDSAYVPGYKYAGRMLDSSSVTILIKALYSDGSFDPEYYACYKFRVDENCVGLITRTPGEYDPSSIKLFIIDTARQTITDHLEMADIFGDAGDAMMKQAWLFYNEKKQLQSFQWTRYSYDHSADDANDTTVDITDQFLMLGFSKTVADTLSVDSAVLAKQFSQLMMK